MKLIPIAILAVSVISSPACTKEHKDKGGITKTIQAGFEDSCSKTYLNNNSKIYWGTSGADKIIYAFDEEGNRYDFTSTSTKLEAVRSFSSSSWPENAKVKMAIWTGKTSSKEESSLNGWVVSGPSLELRSTQGISNTNSFDNTQNIAVMKAGEEKLKSVFGYVRYEVPTFPTGTSAGIKTVTFTADEDLAGLIQIDYAGTEPVARIISGGVKSITVNTRFANKNSIGYEPGYIYAAMIPGTYHNMKLTITPFSEDSSYKEAATGEPFTVNAKGDVIVASGKWTDGGTLPLVAPTPPDPQPATVWPNDTSAFDYGLSPGEVRAAKHDKTQLATYGITSGASTGKIPGEPILVDGINYCGTGMIFYGTRMTISKVKSKWNSTYSNVVPGENYQSFKINRPGSLRFYGAPGTKTADTLNVPVFYLALVAKKEGKTSAKILHTFRPTVYVDGTDSNNRNPDYAYREDFQKYWIELSVTEEDLAGIEEAATVYLYHRYDGSSNIQCNVHFMPLEWTSSVNNPPVPGRKPTFHLAGDSICRTYSTSEDPQAGWGQYLADSLGGNAKVVNCSVGGRSTKTFLVNHWIGLISKVYAGDVVTIQFGHNDASTNADKHTALDGSSTEQYGNYQDNLRLMISEVRAKNATPVLITSTTDRHFDSSNVPYHGLTDYVNAMKTVAREEGVSLIDVNEMTWQLLLSLGPDGSEPYYVTDKRGASSPDNTHYTHLGARTIAGMIARSLKELGLWEE